MTLQERLFELSARLRGEADAYTRRAAAATRQSIDRAARRIEALDRPLATLAQAGLELNQISSHYLARLVTQQTAAGRALVRDGAARLRAVAAAESLPQALKRQAATLADAPRQAVDSLRRSWELTAGAGREVANLAASTLRGLSSRGSSPRPTRAKQAAGARTAVEAGPARGSGTAARRKAASHARRTRTRATIAPRP